MDTVLIGCDALGELRASIDGLPSLAMYILHITTDHDHKSLVNTKYSSIAFDIMRYSDQQNTDTETLYNNFPP